MPQFLIDENLSPLLARYLRQLKYRAQATRELGLKGKSDEEIFSLCEKKKRIIITGDLDFGEMFFRHFGRVSIILLRSRLQSTKHVVKILANLHQQRIFQTVEASNFLVIASEKDVRVRKFLR